MWRSWFARGLFGVLGLTFAYMVLVPDGRPVGMQDATGAVACIALALALLGLAVPRPPAARTAIEVEPASIPSGDGSVAGTSVPLPRPRRLARVVYRAGWVATVGLLALRTAPQSEPLEVAAVGAIGALLVPGLVVAVRGAAQPARTGIFLTPEGVVLETYRRRLVAWDEIREATTFVFCFRGVRTTSLVVHPHRGRGPRMLEWRLPIHAEDAVRVINGLVHDPEERKRLAGPTGPGTVRRLMERDDDVVSAALHTRIQEERDRLAQLD